MSPSPRSSHDPSTIVGVALDIDIEAAAKLQDFDPAGEGRTTSPRPASRGPYKKREDVDRCLEPLRLDAVAGVSDDLIAKRAGVSREQVRQWRRREGIRGRRGHTTPQLATQFALGPVGPHNHLRALVHLASSSPVLGRWQPPAYTLRRPLRYDGFVEVIAHAIERFTTAELAEALGFEERDIIDAIALHARSAS